MASSQSTDEITNYQIANELIVLLRPFVKQMRSENGRPLFRNNISAKEARELQNGIYDIATKLAAGGTGG